MILMSTVWGLFLLGLLNRELSSLLNMVALLHEVANIEDHDYTESSESKKLEADARALSAAVLSVSSPVDAINDILLAYIAHSAGVTLGASGILTSSI